MCSSKGLHSQCVEFSTTGPAYRAISWKALRPPVARRRWAHQLRLQQGITGRDEPAGALRSRMTAQPSSRLSKRRKKSVLENRRAAPRSALIARETPPAGHRKWKPDEVSFPSFHLKERRGTNPSTCFGHLKKDKHGRSIHGLFLEPFMKPPATVLFIL